MKRIFISISAVDKKAAKERLKQKIANLKQKLKLAEDKFKLVQQKHTDNVERLSNQIELNTVKLKGMK